MEVFDGFHVRRRSRRDGRPVYEIPHLHEEAVDKKGMSRREIRVGVAKREMRIGTTLLGQEAPLRLKVFRPIHFIGKSSPRIVLTRSPILRSSIRASPREVRMRAPLRKQCPPRA